MSRLFNPARWATAAAAAAAAITAAIVIISDGDEANGVASARPGAWTSLPSSPLDRSEVGAARIGRFIYVAGGSLAPDVASSNQVARYDTEAGTWSLVAPMPVGVNHPAVAAGAGRCRGALYVYGGYASSGGEVDALQRYDPRTESWTTLPGSGIARAAATLAPVRCSLYAIGGTSGGTSDRLVQAYDIRRGAWRPVRSMRVARDHLASVVVKRSIIVFGGRDFGRNLDVTEQLDTRTGKWRRLPPIPTARSGFGAALVRGWAILVGGEELDPGGETIGTVEAFDTRARKWRRMSRMITPRHGLGVVSRGRRVFAIEGGATPGGSFSDVLEVLRVPKRLFPPSRRGFP